MYEDAYLENAYETRYEPEMDYTPIDLCPCGGSLIECETYEDCSEYA